MAEQEKNNCHDGHRKRMLQKYLQNGIDCFEEHELLEVLLFSIFSRRNTNDIAHMLISAFGSLEDVMSADYNELLKTDGIGESTAAFICFIKDFALLFNQDRRVVYQLNSIKKVLEYCREHLLNLPDESGHILYLDKNYNFAAEGKVQSSDTMPLPFDIRDATVKAINSGCPNLVFIHTHPDGPALPSSADIAETRRIRQVLHSLSLNLVDHIIIFGDDVLSMRYTYEELWRT